MAESRVDDARDVDHDPPRRRARTRLREASGVDDQQMQ
jgi:hypothetical protein